MDSADEDANENFIHEFSKKQRFDRLLFPKDFPGANSKERMAHLHEITEEVQGTDGGVRITKESVNERGTGMTVGDAVATEAERMRTIWHDYNVLPTAPLVSIHYAMWIGDDLLDKPTDYTFDRGNIDTGASETVQIGNGSILAGLEKAILCMTQGSQHFVILSPEWGYGKWGNLPQIPGNATLVFQVYVRFVSYEIEDRFVRMPMRLRQQIPIRVIITTCHRLLYEARKTFEKTSDVKKQVNRNTGEETFKKSGRNNGDFFGAERAGELLDCAANVLERAVCKNLDEEIEMRQMLIYLHTDACLAFRKAKPSIFRKGIDHGEKCLANFDELKEVFMARMNSEEYDGQKQMDEFLKKYYKRITKTRRNLMELYSRDIYGHLEDALRMYGAFDDEVHNEDDDEICFKKYITKDEQKDFLKMKNLVDRRKDDWITQQEGNEDVPEDENSDIPVAAGGQDNEKFKVVKLSAKRLNLEKCIEALNKEDTESEEPQHIPYGGSYGYYKDFIDDLIDGKDPSRTGHMFSHVHTSKKAVNFIIAYASSRGMKCFKRICDGMMNLVITTDESKESSLLGNHQ